MAAGLLVGAVGLAACASTSTSTSPTAVPARGPGSIVSASPIANAPAGARGWRIVYRTTTASGAPAVSAGTVYAPSTARPGGRRLVVAWAHPTLGTGTACTPSRAVDPAAAIPGLASMLTRGWVVTSTDYTGLGSPGALPYLIGQGEARNVLDSVRAADNLAGTDAGTTFAVWGHSQGGHASLFTAGVARRYAPTLRLVGVAAAAPAAQLLSLIAGQFQQPVAWVIGTEVIDLWPKFYPGLSASQVATPLALANAERLGAICITGDVAALTQDFGPYIFKPFFTVTPTDVASWRARIVQNTPPAPAGVPVFVAQGLKDDVVLPPTTAQLEQDWCRRGVKISVNWYPDATHFTVTAQSASSAVDWMAARFAGSPAPDTCGTKPPVAPAQNPPPAGG